jgi:hypothetical protein
MDGSYLRPRRVGEAWCRSASSRSKAAMRSVWRYSASRQDADGEIYVLAVSGVPFGTQGVTLKLTRPDD